MYRFAYLFLMLLAPFAALSGCSSEEGGEPLPTAALFADPEVCDVPCEVVLDSSVGLKGEEEPIAFTWDFGEGPVEGDTRAFHIFETAGTYTVSVTASDGQSSTTDTTTVTAAPQPKASGDIDAAGGSVSQGACTVTVPEGIVSEAFTVEVTELPSMELAAERTFDAERFVALGKAYEVSMPLKSGTAMDVAVKDAEAEGAGPSELAWLVRALSRPHPEADDPETTVSPALLAAYVLLPVTGVDADGTAHGDIYGGRRVQLVKMAAPLDFEPASSAAELGTKATPTPLIVTSFAHAPTTLSRQAYMDAIRAGVTKSHDVLVNARGFVGPEAVVVSVTKMKPGKLGNVNVLDHDLMQLSNGMSSAEKIKKAVAHEYFHLIQNISRNRASSLFYYDQDGWFAEGTAAWAMDDVFDDMRDFYHATRVKRFRVPLLQKTSTTSPRDIYETVGFWKWAEAKNPDIIRRILEDQYTATHKTVPGLRHSIDNLTFIDFLSSLKKQWKDADFLEFTYNARYLKDFETAENRAGEIWDPTERIHPYLGKPSKVFYRLGESVFDGTGDSGDSESTPVRPELELKPHLTADVIQIESYDLSGTLHVRFPVLSAPLDAKVIVIDRESGELQDMFTVRDLSTKHSDVQAKFSPDEEAVIFVVDPRWSYPSSTTTIKGEILAWVEDPCGPLPTNVIDVTPTDDLYVALTTAPAGSVVRLAPGNYTPPIRDWTLPDAGGQWPAQALVTGITLAGSGEGQTTLTMTGDPYGAVGLSTYGSATIRNLTISAREFWGVSCVNPQSVTLCNVTVETYGNDAITWNPWPGRTSSTLTIQESTLSNVGGEQGGTGVYLSCYDEGGHVTADIRNSNIFGWMVGVYYSTSSEESCSVSVSTDCKGFDDNESNVYREMCNPPTCDGQEECP